jgi:hypothetical protein
VEIIGRVSSDEAASLPEEIVLVDEAVGWRFMDLASNEPFVQPLDFDLRYSPDVMNNLAPEWPTERAFLHALSTPLSTLGLELDHLLALLKDGQEKDSKKLKDAQESAQQLRKQLDRVFTLIQTRRAQLPPSSAARP